MAALRRARRPPDSATIVSARSGRDRGRHDRPPRGRLGRGPAQGRLVRALRAHGEVERRVCGSRRRWGAPRDSPGARAARAACGSRQRRTAIARARGRARPLRRAPSVSREVSNSLECSSPPVNGRPPRRPHAKPERQRQASASSMPSPTRRCCGCCASSSAHRHQVRLRRRAVRRVHGAYRRRADAQLRAPGLDGAAAGEDRDDRRPVARRLAPGPESVGRARRAAMRLLPEPA